MEVGLVGEVARRVDAGTLAAALGSGSLDVLGTPALIALVEAAACAAVEACLEQGQTTVGTRLDVRHLAPTPPGIEVRGRAELVEVDGRRLVFRVEAFDSHEKIGEGVHERVVVDGSRHRARAGAKTVPSNQ